MTSVFTSALMGLLLMSQASAQVLPADTVAPEAPTYTVSMTGYNAVPEQTDGDPYTTASGAYSDPDVVAARSVDLKEDLPFGTVIEIVQHNDTKSPNCGFSVVEEHLGLRVIADSMHPRKRNQIDILLPNEKTVRAAGKVVNPAVALGVCKEVEIRVVGKIDIRDMPKTQQQLRLAVGVLEKAPEQNLAIRK